MESFNPAFILAVVQFLWLIAVTVAVWLRKPGEDASLELQNLKDSIRSQDQINAAAFADLHSRNELLKERLGNLPTHTDIRVLIEGMAALKGEISAIGKGQMLQQQSLQLIQEYLNKNR